MIKLLTVIGARPQIIKAAALSREIANSFSVEIEEKILHTGQHYDSNMSGVFFKELGIPAPDYNLGVGSGSHGVQTARMIEGIENVLQQEHFDGVVLYGDTNSTLAGAVAASKLHVPIFHIEAGLRSFNMAMPEEINRIVCDQLSSVLFAPTRTAVNNLAEEGFGNDKVQFTKGKERLVINAGDVMYDNSRHFSQFSQNHTQIVKDLGLTENDFILSTIHRNNNTDEPERLESIIKALIHISETENMTVVLPLHPRTKKLLPVNLSVATYQKLISNKYIRIIPPVSFFEIIELEKNARIVMTDSGGVQKEAFFFEKPCVILRPETEWVEIIDNNAGIIADADYERIIEAYKILSGTKVEFPPLFGDGHAAIKILQTIKDYLS